MAFMLQKIVSGGQTGADQGALDAAIAMGVDHGGWLPKDRKTENGPLPPRYQLQEMASSNYADRTLQNVLDSDGTLIISHGPLTGGSALTYSLARRHRRPCLHIDRTRLSRDQAVHRIVKWIQSDAIRVLNTAGPRASSDPRIHAVVKDLITAVVKTMRGE